MKRLAFLIATMYAGAGMAQIVPVNTVPTGGVFKVGSGTVSKTGSDLTVTVGSQSSGNALIDWTGGFNVGSEASVTFKNGVPSASGVLQHIVNLDRTGAASQILGKIGIDAGIDVILVNPNGIIVGGSASIATSNNGQGSGLYLVAGNATADGAGLVSIDLTNAPILLTASTTGTPTASSLYAGTAPRNTSTGLNYRSTVQVTGATATATAPVGMVYTGTGKDVPVIGLDLFTGDVNLSGIPNNVTLQVPNNAITRYTAGSNFHTKVLVGDNDRLVLNTDFSNTGTGTVDWIFPDVTNSQAVIHDTPSYAYGAGAKLTSNIKVGTLTDSTIETGSVAPSISGTLTTADGYNQINLNGASKLEVYSRKLATGLKIVGDGTEGSSVNIKVTGTDYSTATQDFSDVSISNVDNITLISGNEGGTTANNLNLTGGSITLTAAGDLDLSNSTLAGGSGTVRYFSGGNLVRDGATYLADGEIYSLVGGKTSGTYTSSSPIVPGTPYSYDAPTRVSVSAGRNSRITNTTLSAIAPAVVPPVVVTPPVVVAPPMETPPAVVPPVVVPCASNPVLCVTEYQKDPRVTTNPVQFQLVTDTQVIRLDGSQFRVPSALQIGSRARVDVDDDVVRKISVKQKPAPLVKTPTVSIIENSTKIVENTHK